MSHAIKSILLGLLVFLVYAGTANAAVGKRDWPNWRQWSQTDFSKHLVSASEFSDGGPGKDGIPAIDDPNFVAVQNMDLDPRSPMVVVEIDEIARAYPLSILIWHEIVNDEIAGQPITVTFCPLCNAAIVFDRRVDGQVTSFGVTGILRKSDLVMYDRATQSWWQQFTGRAIVGTQIGKTLVRLPAQLISFSEFKQAYPDGEVLIPPLPATRPYGRNPYVNYDTKGRPFDVFVKVPRGFSKMDRVVVVGNQAWKMTSIAKAGTITQGDLRLRWQAGQASALDTARMADGRDVGSIVVERQTPAGEWQLIVYDVTFAFVFAAFQPKGKWHR